MNADLKTLARLRFAIGMRDIAELTRLLDSEPCLANTWFPERETAPLQSALDVQDTAHAWNCVSALLAAGADPNAESGRCLPALHVAVGNVALTKAKPHLIDMLVRHGARLNRRSAKNGETPIEAAAAAGNLAGAKRLLELGALLTANDAAYEDDVLFGALHNDQWDVARYLRDSGLEPTFFTAMLLRDERLLEDMAKKDPELVEARYKGRYTHWKDMRPLAAAVSLGSETMTALLIGLGANVNGLAGDPLSPLAVALADCLMSHKFAEADRLWEKAKNTRNPVKQGKMMGKVSRTLKAPYPESHMSPIARLLLDRGAQPDLTASVILGDSDCVRERLAEQVGLHAYATALKHSILFRRVKCFGILIAHELSAEVSGSDRADAVLELALSTRNDLMLSVLIESGVRPHSGRTLESALRRRHGAAIARQFLEEGANPNSAWSDRGFLPGRNLLHGAVSSWCSADAIALLLEFGADPNAREDTPYGFTALHCAALRGKAYYESVKDVLIRAGALETMGDLVFGEPPSAWVEYAGWDEDSPDDGRAGHGKRGFGRD